MKQADIFAESEGDNWLERNRALVGRDPVSEAIDHLGLKPERVLEIGCANGWRLAALRGKFDCEVNGVEPSMQGCIEAAQRRVPVWRITAESLPAGNEAYDLVIYGFILYICDPIDFFSIVKEGDRVLKDNGYLIIHDFEASRPFKRKYKHRDGLWSHHFDQPKLWLSHPAYSVIAEYHAVERNETVTVLQKNMELAFPERSE